MSKDKYAQSRRYASSIYISRAPSLVPPRFGSVSPAASSVISCSALLAHYLIPGVSFWRGGDKVHVGSVHTSASSFSPASSHLLVCILLSTLVLSLPRWAHKSQGLRSGKEVTRSRRNGHSEVRNRRRSTSWWPVLGEGLVTKRLTPAPRQPSV